MKIIRKSKRGLTLVEMVVVISILVILSSVLTLTIVRFFALGSFAEETVSDQADEMSNFISSANAQFENIGF